jgi:hypothetical protein
MDWHATSRGPDYRPLVLLALCIAARAFAGAPLPEFHVGETARVDVVAPMPLVVVDPVRTEALRAAEAKRVPAIFRHEAGAADAAEAQLRAVVDQKREAFLKALEGAFQKRKINPSALTNARFARVVVNFQNRNKGFPVVTNLARLWALDQSHEDIVTGWAGRLREVAGRRLRADNLPAEAKSGPWQIRLLPASATVSGTNWESIQKQSVQFPRTNLHALKRTREEFQKGFPAEEQALAKFLAGFLKENCVFDAALTLALRSQRTEPLFAADHYEPGETLVSAGQVIDRRAWAALEELRTRTAPEHFQVEKQVLEAQARAATDEWRERTARAEIESTHASRQNRWLIGGLLGVALLMSLVLLQLTRPRRVRRAFVAPDPARASLPDPHVALHQLPAPSVEPEEPTDEGWRQRAVVAEEAAARSAAVVRAGLIPHLAQWLKQKLVRGLITQRSQLLNTQQTAEAEVAELERRLAQVHAPLEERLGAYEKRIAELERELAAKGEENRELIKAKIALTRQKLATEGGKNRLNLN